MAETNFYESLDLRYGEIGIAMTAIDRMNPGAVPFTIPILTPNLNNDVSSTNKVIQRDKSNLQNENLNAVDVSNIEISNTIYITIPKELCTLPAPKYNINGTATLDGSYRMDGTSKTTIRGSIDGNGSIDIAGSSNISGFDINASSGKLVQNNYPNINSLSINSASGSGSISIDGDGNVNLTGTISGSETSEGTGHIKIDGTIKGTIQTELHKDNRYIPAKSKWLIMFIGGDINMPCVIARLPD